MEADSRTRARRAATDGETISQQAKRATGHAPRPKGDTGAPDTRRRECESKGAEIDRRDDRREPCRLQGAGARAARRYRVAAALAAEAAALADLVRRVHRQ